MLIGGDEAAFQELKFAAMSSNKAFCSYGEVGSGGVGG